MNPIENPLNVGYRAERVQAHVANPTRKKQSGKSFFSFLRTDETAQGEVETNLDGSKLAAEALEQQLDQIHELGHKLLKQQSFEHLKEYKAAIKALLQHFLRNGIETTELVSNRNILNQKKYTIITIIDEKLERLVSGILQSQVKQLEILSKLEEIQGLLIDLTH